MITVEFQVAGMTCGHCEGSVRREISKISGVEAVTADAQSGAVVVSSTAPVAHQDVAAAVDEAGYRLA